MSTILGRVRCPVWCAAACAAFVACAVGIARADAPYRVGGDQGGAYASGGDEKFTGAVDVPTIDTGLPRAFAVRFRSPNPVHGDLALEIDLPKPALVAVRLFDVAGREVHRVTERRAAGTFRIEARMGGLPSGVYLCRVTTTDVRSGAIELETVRKILSLK
jgi:hypothetical protein